MRDGNLGFGDGGGDFGRVWATVEPFEGWKRNSVLGILHMNLGATLAAWGKQDGERRDDAILQAREHLDTARFCFEQVRARDFLPELHRHFASAALAAGELDEALTQAEAALALARELDMRGEEGICLRILGEIAVAQERLEDAAGYLAESHTLLKEVGDEYERARCQLYIARVYMAHAEQGACLIALEQCMATFERLDAGLELSLARTLKGKIIQQCRL